MKKREAYLGNVIYSHNGTKVLDPVEEKKRWNEFHSWGIKPALFTRVLGDWKDANAKTLVTLNDSDVLLVTYVRVEDLFSTMDVMAKEIRMWKDVAVAACEAAVSFAEDLGAKPEVNEDVSGTNDLRSEYLEAVLPGFQKLEGDARHDGRNGAVHEVQSTDSHPIEGGE